MENLEMENVEMESVKRENNRRIASGLKKMFLGNLGLLILASILMVIAIIAIVAQNVSMFAVVLLVLIVAGILVFRIVDWVGLYGVGQYVPGCATAFILSILQMVISWCKQIPIIGGVAAIAAAVLALVEMYLVCTSVAEVLREIGASDIAELGGKVWKLTVAVQVLAILCTFLQSVTVLYLISSIVVLGLNIMTTIMYLKFLHEGSYILSA